LYQIARFGQYRLARDQRRMKSGHLFDNPAMPPITAVEIGHERAGIDDDCTHSPKPARCFGWVDRSLGPSMTPHTSANRSWQLAPFLPSLAFCNASRTRSDCGRPSSRARLDSQAASGSGSFTVTVFIASWYCDSALVAIPAPVSIARPAGWNWALVRNRLDHGRLKRRNFLPIAERVYTGWVAALERLIREGIFSVSLPWLRVGIQPIPQRPFSANQYSGTRPLNRAIAALLFAEDTSVDLTRIDALARRPVGLL